MRRSLQRIFTIVTRSGVDSTASAAVTGRRTTAAGDITPISGNIAPPRPYVDPAEASERKEGDLAVIPRAPSQTLGSYLALPVFVGILAAAIFAVDTFLFVRDAVAVLYVIVVILSVNFLERRGLLALAIGCCVAAIVSYLLEHGASYDYSASIRLLISLVAIGISSMLTLNSLSATKGLQKQAALLDLSSDAILTRNMDGVVTYWNRGAEVLYGWQRSDALGKTAPLLLQTTAKVPFEEIDAELVRSGRWEGELAGTRRDGQPLIVSSRWSLIQDYRGRPVSIMETDTDITDRRRAEEGLVQAKNQLAHVTRVTTLGELTASIAHEVNQPLAAVVTNGEVCLRLLDREALDVTELREVIGDMVSAGRRASEIIKRLRALFRKTEAQNEALNLNDLIREVVPLLQQDLVNKRVSLRLDLAPALPLILGDRVQLEQVIVNLLVNSAEAMESVVDRTRDLVIRSQVDGDGRVCVAVEDSGVGIDPANSTHLFEAFHTTKPGGMGMGLPICRSIVENHGGKLWATANAGPGATFQFTLPPTQTAKP